MSKGIYVGVEGLARKVKSLYVPIFSRQKPIYGEGTGEELDVYFTPENLNYFIEADGLDDWTYTTETSVADTGIGIDNGLIKFTPNKIGATLTINFKQLPSASSTYLIYPSDSITCTYSKGEPDNRTEMIIGIDWYWDTISTDRAITETIIVSVTTIADLYFAIPDIMTVNTREIIGYENVYTARKVKKGYVGVNGIARMFYSANIFGGYTGDYTVSQVEIDGVSYDLYTLTTSGVLTINDSVQFWMCGGGEGGGNGSATSLVAVGGRGGSGGHVENGALSSGTYVITIGAGGNSAAVGGDSSIGEAYTAKGGGNVVNDVYGGSGGGGQGYVTGSGYSTREGRTGSGISTIPFGISSLQKHSAGGGGGSAGFKNSSGTWRYSSGGDGGSDGSDGGSGNLLDVAYLQSAGGEYGGGKGGSSLDDPTAATFYGSGGGGDYAVTNMYDGTQSAGTGANGYQGVCYILVPVEAA